MQGGACDTERALLHLGSPAGMKPSMPVVTDETILSSIEGVALLEPVTCGEEKVMDARQAVEAFIEPGMLLHTLATHCLPYGLVYQLCRRFWGRRPGFGLVTLGASGHVVLMLKGELLDRLVTSYCGDIYPSPSPHPAFQGAWESGNVKIENWSLLSLVARLQAGAMGWRYAEVPSLAGTTMEADNGLQRSGDGGVPLAPSLRPDVCLVHGWVADRYGNVLFCPPMAEGLWGALGASRAVVASVEKIVDTDFVRRHNYLPMLPATRVSAVVELPFGAHPSGLYGCGIRDFNSYAEDYDFIVELRSASRNEKDFGRWLNQYVLAVGDHQQYLKRVGPSRLADLVQGARPDAWQSRLASRLKQVDDGKPPTGPERMAVAAARWLERVAEKKRAGLILAGQGISNLAAWLARALAARSGRQVELVAEIGMYGYLPAPASPFIFNFSNLPRCLGLSGALEALGALVCGPDSVSVGSLAAAQVDERGNLNSTMIPGVMFLVGSGGAADVAWGAKAVVACVPALPGRYVERVPYITARGANVVAVVNQWGVLERDPATGRLVLSAVMAESDDEAAERVARLKAAVGWKLRVSPDAELIGGPRVEELKALRLWDPEGAFLQN